VTPSSGAGATQTFGLQFGDTAGATDLATTWVWFNTTFASSSANSCLMYYDRASNMLNLLNDAGTAYTSRSVGSSGTLQNSKCSIAMGSSRGRGERHDVYAESRHDVHAGVLRRQSLFMFAANAGGVNSGWQWHAARGRC
jgi:hypothetical protein